MGKKKKMSSKERQTLISNELRQADQAITGNEFADLTNVSRQVIVQDISILKAKKVPIIATSRGYMLENKTTLKEQLIVAVSHTPEQTEKELNLIVDHGVTVKDVTVEHALYGELTASIMVSNRVEVAAFIRKIKETESPYLSTLTEGVHLHTLEADHMDKIEAACEALAAADILL